MGAPIGNTNGKKENRLWADAIRKKVIQGKSLDKLAAKLVQMAEEGDMSALKELGDRLDGKAKQQIEATGLDDGPVLQRVEMIIVDASSSSTP